MVDDLLFLKKTFYQNPSISINFPHIIQSTYFQVQNPYDNLDTFLVNSIEKNNNLLMCLTR